MPIKAQLQKLLDRIASDSRDVHNVPRELYGPDAQIFAERDGNCSVTLLPPGPFSVVGHQPSDAPIGLSLCQCKGSECRIDAAPDCLEGGFQFLLIEIRKCGRTSQNRLGSFNGDDHTGRDLKVNSRPLRKVHFSRCQTRKREFDAIRIVHAVPALYQIIRIDPHRSLRLLPNRHLLISLIEAGVGINDVVHVRRHKQGVGPPPYEASLNGGREHRSKDCGNGSNSCPRIPIDTACLAQPPALANAVFHRPKLAEQSHVLPLSLLEPILP